MFNVSVRCLQVFATVAESGSFVAAADRLNISQPSVSDHVHKLERRLGSRLFERRRGMPARLTPAGRTLLGDVQALLADADRLQLQAGAQREAALRRVNLSCQRPLVQAGLPARLAAFAAEHAELELSLHTGNVDEVIERVRDGRADLGVFLARRPPPELQPRLLGCERFVFVTGPGHALAGRPGVTPDELARHKFVRASHHSGYATDVDAMLAEAGIGTRPAASRATDFAMVVELAAAGVGVLCTLARGVQRELAAGQLVLLPVVLPTDVPLLQMGVWLATPPGAVSRPAVQTLAARLQAAWEPA